MILLLGAIAAACALVSASSAAAAVSTTTTITNVSNTAPAAGDPVTFTVSVIGSDSSPAGGGTVNLVDASGHIWASGPVSNGAATITVSGGFPSQSTLQIQAKFTGFSTWGKSSSSFVTITVGQTALPRTAISLTPDRSEITSGDSVTFSIAVTDIDTGTTPTGIVTLKGSYNGGSFVPLFPNSQLDINPENGGSGTITDQFNPSGTYTIRAEFQGSQYQPSTRQITLVVDPPAVTTTTTTTTVLANGGVISVTPTEDVTLVATVKQNVAVSPPAGDYVNFFRQLNNSTNGYKEPLGPADITWDVTDGSAPATGTATIDTGSWPRGTYTVYAEFIGDQYDIASTGTSTLGVSGPEPTTTTYVGDLAGTTGNPITLSGKLLDENGLPLGNETLTLSLNNTPSETCTATTTNAGIATCSVGVTEGGGSYPVKAAFAGDGDLQPSSGSDTAVIAGPTIIPTHLPYQGQTSGTAGTTETLTFKLTDDGGAGLASAPVAISVDGGAAQTVSTDASGFASITANLSAGTHSVAASYAGSNDGTTEYLSSTGTGQIVVNKVPTSLTYLGPSSVTVGNPANIQYKLTDGNGNPLAGKTVSITVNGSTVSVTTDGSGIASVAQTLPAGSYPSSATFVGLSDPVYDGSSGFGALTVNKIPTATTYNGDTTAGAGKVATLSATLVDVNGNPLSGKTVTIGFGQSSCSAVTNASGLASCSITVIDGPGSYPITASFAGDATYLLSSGPSTMTVTGKSTTAIVDNVTGNFLLGSSLTLSGTLTANGLPLSGKTVTLTFGGTSCSGTTNGSGIATCGITVPGPTGPTTTTATFAGDAAYKPAADSKPALVYAFAPGGGNFVVGDLTATGSVYFWGSQWWKVNQLSAGDAQAVDPGAFKGFAARPSNPQCGGTWSTDPGNSTPPPDGPLPAYMAVIVTSQNHKAPGPIVTGNIVHIVIVKTNAGYDGNPGHDGTGTVVATVC